MSPLDFKHDMIEVTSASNTAMHATTLVNALSTSPYATLAHLRNISALSPTNLPAAENNNHQSIRTDRFQTLSRLLHHVLPLVSLSPAISTHAPPHLSVPFHSLLRAIRANAALPSVLPNPPIPAYIHPHLLKLPDSAFDDASTSLAQEASIDADELTEIWNRLLPEYSASTPEELAKQIRLAKLATARATVSAVRLDSCIVHTRAVALTTQHKTLRSALDGLEADTVERAKQPSAQIVYLRLLCARGRAVAAKLRLLRAEIAAAMYTPECARALRITAGDVKARTADVESQLMDKRLRLQQYRALGAEYLQVVGQLAKARNLLENKLWARKELSSG